MNRQWHLLGMTGFMVLMCAQGVQAEIISITNVQLNAVENGLELRLENPCHQGFQPTTARYGRTVVTDIPSTQLRLSSMTSFQEDNPVPGIASVAVSPLDENMVRITVTGVIEAPRVEVEVGDCTLRLTITPSALTPLSPVDSSTQNPDQPPESDGLRIVVTADNPPLSPYRVPDSTLGSRTNTSLLNIPQSVQVIPRQVIEEQGVNTVNEALRNAAGVSTGRVATDNQSLVPVIRGFETQNVLRNGLRDETFGFGAGTSLSNVERVEILRGPASVLYGQGNLGGTLNLVTEQPLDQSRYEVAFTLGQFDRQVIALDLTGPLNQRGLAYRFNAAYENSDTFRDFEELETIFVSPVFRVIDTETTSLTLDLEYYQGRSWGNAPELPAAGTVLDNPNGTVGRTVNLGEPSLSRTESQVTRLGYQFEHQFHDNLVLRHELLAAFRDTPDSRFVIPTRLGLDQRTLVRLFAENPGRQQNLVLNTSLNSTFRTGSINHELLVGVELTRESLDDTINFRFLNPIQIFDPVYSPESLSRDRLRFTETETQTNAVGLYLQNQVSLFENVILVLGGRLDLVNQSYEDALNPSDSFDRQENVFSPRIGLVYQPSDTLSFYASYIRSFEPVIGRERSLDPVTNQTRIGNLFEPERGTQYEIGVKADLLDGRLLTTLALYQLERTNVVTQGPDSPLSSVQVGEQRSRGVELNVVGEILPGWNIIAGYAYTDAEITSDNQFEEGNRLPNAPKHAASLWSTYEIQRGNLRGLGFGLGLFFQGERSGDLNNTFDLPGYLRVDAALFYRRRNFQIGLNVQNLFDTEYYEGARNNVRVIPGEPLTVSGSIRWEF